MRVKCIENSKNPNLTINKIYTVYEGEFIADAYERLYIMFKIQDDYGSVIPYDAKYFEISSDKNPNYLEKKYQKISIGLLINLLAMTSFGQCYMMKQVLQ